MKTRIAIIIALAAAAGVSTGAYATSVIPAPGAPTADAGAPPVLFPSEQGAFKALEVATQLVESSILQNGCDIASYDLKVRTWAAGRGNAQLDGVKLYIDTDGGSYEGRKYFVTGGGTLGDLVVTDVNGEGSYNIGSEMQELTTTWFVSSPWDDSSDDFRGTIIKDYWRLDQSQAIPEFASNHGRLVSTVIDYGYQEIEKHGYIAAKYWQQSQAWRQNGVRSGTYWYKTRVAPNGDECTIEVKLQGTTGVANTANRQGFNQVGTIEVGIGSGDSTGEFFKK